MAQRKTSRAGSIAVIEADSGKAVAVEMSGAGYALLGDGGSCAARWRVIAGSAR